MNEAKSLFDKIVTELCSHHGATEGNMMHASALKHNEKVFLFFEEDKQIMGFKLSKEFDPNNFGLKNWKYLSPFKKKPSMKAWIMVEVKPKLA